MCAIFTLVQALIRALISQRIGSRGITKHVSAIGEEHSRLCPGRLLKQTKALRGKRGTTTKALKRKLYIADQLGGF